ITELQQHLNKTTGKIATVSGRYYAMDRDKRWERVKLAYDALATGIGQYATDPIAAVEQSYNLNTSDEFIKPTVIVNDQQQPLAIINDGDVAICFNFRTDRCREISQVLTQADMTDYGMRRKNIDYTTMTEYDQTFTNVHVAFETDNLNKTLGEVIASNGLKQIRIAETEKYPHVTFFFSGGREIPFDGEQRILIPSPKVATYDLKPEMSALEVTDAIVKEIDAESADFVCLNFANADMVGHTGIWQAAVQAVETVDRCVERVVTAGLAHGYTIFLTADHGNADYMINEDGTPNTAHTLNPVPLFIIDNAFHAPVKSGKLGDIAPTILKWMELPIPPEMTGEVLI
ncbi:MAG TPA: 2,3-bisphosphoglycerate-independent phosphoglycerate mutase, partial [Chitinophagaceae bacterium]|nr:2,3-bisphosphoglycerate-independent phosphoglycerate mutase [Chitinophagaceae bacterium]